MLVATVVTAVVGVVIGAAAARLHGPYLAGATLALAVAVPGHRALLQARPSAASRGSGCGSPEMPDWVLDAAYFVTAHD